jgi:hypothetical protein
MGAVGATLVVLVYAILTFRAMRADVAAMRADVAAMRADVAGMRRAVADTKQSTC